MMAAVSKIMMTALGGILLVSIGAGDALAAKRKSARHSVETPRPDTPSRYRDRTAFAPGPIYFGNKYLGNDPDPFIRLMIQRDPGAVFGGDN